MALTKENILSIIPSHLSEEINERITLLHSIVDELEKKLPSFPEGKIHVLPGKTEKSFRYYLRTDHADKTGIYLDKSKRKLKKIYSDKRYYEDMLKNSKRELQTLLRAQRALSGDSLIEAYLKQTAGVKAIIDPLIVDDETFIREWINCYYEGLPFDINDDSEHYSDKGERMRSKSEVLIANSLIRHNIPYKYECPIIIKNGEKRYPDFTILDVKNRKEKYWEHLGRMDDMSYVAKNLCKLNEYKKLGIFVGKNLIISYEYSYKQLGAREIEELIGTI